jgi:hypothetical protein
MLLRLKNGNECEMHQMRCKEQRQHLMTSLDALEPSAREGIITSERVNNFMNGVAFRVAEKDVTQEVMAGNTATRLFKMQTYRMTSGVCLSNSIGSVRMWLLRKSSRSKDTISPAASDEANREARGCCSSSPNSRGTLTTSLSLKLNSASCRETHAN